MAKKENMREMSIEGEDVKGKEETKYGQMLHEDSKGGPCPDISAYIIHDLSTQMSRTVWRMKCWGSRHGKMDFAHCKLKRIVFRRTKQKRFNNSNRGQKKDKFHSCHFQKVKRSGDLNSGKPQYPLKPSSQYTKQKSLRGVLLVCFALFLPLSQRSGNLLSTP